MEEQWKEIDCTFKRKGKEYTLTYLISNTGRVKAPKREVKHRWGGTYTIEEKELVVFPMNRGYMKSAAGLIHRLVARAFIPNPNDYNEINHKDGNKENNHVSNLEWTDHRANLNHYYNSNLALENGHVTPVRVWNKEGKWVGDFASKTNACNFIGIKPTTLSTYLRDLHKRKFTGKDCYIVREISYEQYKNEKKEDLPKDRVPQGKRRKRSKT